MDGGSLLPTEQTYPLSASVTNQEYKESEAADRMTVRILVISSGSDGKHTEGR
jgi:hypothetical protein